MPQPTPKRPKIGELLREAGLIDDFQLQTALGEQRRWGGRLGTSLVKLGFVEEPVLMRFLSRRLEVPLIQLGEKRPAPEVLDVLPADLAEKYHCVPLFLKHEKGRNVLYLGMEDPTDLEALDDLSFRTGQAMRPVLVSPSELRDALKRFYEGKGRTGRSLRDFDETPLVPGDTAPLLDAAQLEMPGAMPAERLPPMSAEAPLREVPHAPPPPRSAEPLAGASESAVESKPRDVPTRAILRALTQILIDKGVLTREELVARLRRGEP